MHCLFVCGDRPKQHRMFAEQVTAEYFVRTEGRGRTVDEWKARPEQPDNPWLDCLVGCAAAASMQGAFLFGTDGEPTRRRERICFKELQKRKRN
ncbi:MAG: terminase gpA endonuclease subunit [Pirellulaceae bacterium]